MPHLVRMSLTPLDFVSTSYETSGGLETWEWPKYLIVVGDDKLHPVRASISHLILSSHNRLGHKDGGTYIFFISLVENTKQDI